MSPTNGSIRETPVYIRSSSGALAGVLSVSDDPWRETGVIVFHGGGEFNLPSHRNRWTALFARRLAGTGFHVLRFSYPGVGDSTGEAAGFDLEDPFAADGEAVTDWMLRQTPSLVLVGACFGARTALAASGRNDVVGLVLASLPIADRERLVAQKSTAALVRGTLRKRRNLGLGDPERRRLYVGIAKRKAALMVGRLSGSPRGSSAQPSWVSDAVSAPLVALAERNVPLLIVYGTADEFRADFVRARAEVLAPTLLRPEVEVEVDLAGRLHGFTSVDVQRRFTDLSTGWIAARIGPSKAVGANG